MRQLMGFLAYIITGGTDATGRIMSQGSGRYLYANAVFEGGEGPLFDLVRRSFDPATVTHPDLDEDLWRGTTKPEDWLDPDDVPVAPAFSSDEEREQCFKVAKRRFFFEHVRGADLLRTWSPPTRTTSTGFSTRVWTAIPSWSGRWSSPSTGSSSRTAPRTRTTGSPCGRATATTCGRRQHLSPSTRSPPTP